MREIKIIGNSTFINKTKEALQLIKTNDVCSFVFINKYIGIIKQSDYSGMDVFTNPPTFLVGNRTSNSDIFWYASCILHDATHSFLFFTAKEKGEDAFAAYQGHDAEMYCLTAQIELLKRINAPSYLIEYAEGLYDNKWYEVPESKRHW